MISLYDLEDVISSTSYRLTQYLNREATDDTYTDKDFREEVADVSRTLIQLNVDVKELMTNLAPRPDDW